MAIVAKGELPHPTHVAIKDFFDATYDTNRLEDYEKELAPHALSFEHHRRQLNILIVGHIPIVLAVLLMSIIGGHHHLTNVLFIVYLPLVAAFIVSLFLFGLQTKYIAIPRAFSLSMFLIGLWTTISVIYAVYTQIRMREWYDILLLVLQVIDVSITIGYFYTAEQLAGIGGEASAIHAEIHASGLVLSPIAHKLTHAMDFNKSVTRQGILRRVVNSISNAIS